MVDPLMSAIVTELLQQLAAQNELILKYASQLARGTTGNVLDHPRTLPPLTQEFMNVERSVHPAAERVPVTAEPDTDDIWTDGSGTGP